MSYYDWSKWEEKYRRWQAMLGNKMALSYPTLRGLLQWFAREAQARNIDPHELDIESYLDPTLTYEENKIILGELLKGQPYTEKEIDEMYEEYKTKLQQEVREKYPEIIEPLEERIADLEKTEKTSKRRYRQIKQLERELSETERMLEEEKAKPPEIPPIKVRVLRPFQEGIMDYTVGSVVETKDVDWMLSKIQRGLVEKVGLEVSVITKKPLTREEVRTLEDEFKAALMGELGRIPANVMSEFRVTLRKVETEPYEEALRVILEKAHEIAVRETVRRSIRPGQVTPIEKPKEKIIHGVTRHDEDMKDEEGEDFHIPAFGLRPASFPEYPKSELPFPRRPSSVEKEDLWNAFAYAIQEKGLNPWQFRREFEERISNITFKDWDMIKDRFNALVNALAEGEELVPLWQWRGVPPPSLEFLYSPTIEPTEGRKEAIRHFTSVVIRNCRSSGQVPTIEQLEVLLDQYGVSNVSFDEIEDAIKEGYEKKDAYFVNISLDELNSFLGT